MIYGLERRLPYAFLMAARVISSVQPRCPGCSGRRGLAILSQELRSQWERFETICWSWRSDRQAYWHLCVPCHNQVYEAWPRALHANPDQPCLQAAVRESVSPRYMEDFYLTAAHPERWTEAALEPQNVGPRRRCSRCGRDWLGVRSWNGRAFSRKGGEPQRRPRKLLRRAPQSLSSEGRLTGQTPNLRPAPWSQIKSLEAAASRPLH